MEQLFKLQCQVQRCGFGVIRLVNLALLFPFDFCLQFFLCNVSSLFSPLTPLIYAIACPLFPLFFSLLNSSTFHSAVSITTISLASAFHSCACSQQLVITQLKKCFFFSSWSPLAVHLVSFHRPHIFNLTACVFITENAKWDNYRKSCLNTALPSTGSETESLSYSSLEFTAATSKHWAASSCKQMRPECVLQRQYSCLLQVQRQDGLWKWWNAQMTSLVLFLFKLCIQQKNGES